MSLRRRPKGQQSVVWKPPAAPSCDRRHQKSCRCSAALPDEGRKRGQTSTGHGAEGHAAEAPPKAWTV
jgi:hypothetical protein